KFLGDVLLGGVVDQDIELAEGLDGLADGPLADVAFSNISFDQNAATPLLLNQLSRAQSIFGLLQIEDGDIGPLFGEMHGNGLADPRIPAADERCLSFELARRF